MLSGENKKQYKKKKISLKIIKQKMVKKNIN